MSKHKNKSDWRKLAKHSFESDLDPVIDQTRGQSEVIGRTEMHQLIEELQRRPSMPGWLPSLVTALIVSAIFVAYIKLQPTPTIQPDNGTDRVTIIEPSELVAQSMHDWVSELSDVFEQASSDAINGRWKNDSEFGKEFEEKLTSTRQKHFLPINRMLDSNLSGEKWSNDRASALFKEISKGFHEVSQ